jgi:hypothetical protein
MLFQVTTRSNYVTHRPSEYFPFCLGLICMVSEEPIVRLKWWEKLELNVLLAQGAASHNS